MLGNTGYYVLGSVPVQMALGLAAALILNRGIRGQTFFRVCRHLPSVILRRLRKLNPAPYGFFINLGQSEYLVGASPEMFVRVRGERVETCPISGTIARGGDAIADARQILTLLNSQKDASEHSSTAA